MVACRECGAEVSATATWCGRCGALTGEPRPDRRPADRAPGRDGPRVRFVDAVRGPGGESTGTAVATESAGARRPADPATPTGPAEDAERGPARTTRRVSGALLVVLVVLIGAVVAMAPGAGRQVGDPAPKPPEPPPVPGRWAWGRLGAVDAGPPDRADVRRAGPEHVLVGGHVVGVSGGATAGARWLPDTVAAAVAPDGRWGVAESGGVVWGTVGRDDATWVRVTGRWAPVGAPVAWHDDAAVFSGTGGLLGLVDRGGTVRWTTDRPVAVDTAVGATARGRLPDGTGVVVALGDGTVTPRPPGALVPVLDDAGLRLVVGGDLVEATGSGSWRRMVTGASTGEWSTTVDGLVLATDGSVQLRSRETGDQLALHPLRDAAPVDGGAVGVDDDVVVLRRWDGSLAWSQAFDGREIADVTSLDGDRVAVTLVGADDALIVKVLDREGVTLATVLAGERAPRPTPVIAGRLDGMVGIVGGRLPDAGGLGWVHAATGRSARAAAALAIAGPDAPSWQYVGTVADADGPRVVRVRPGDGQVVVRVGDADPVTVDVDPDGVGVDPDGVGVDDPVLGTSTLTFVDPDGPSLLLVDWREGTTVAVEGLSAPRTLGDVPLATAAPSADVDPFGVLPRTIVALDPASGDERWRVEAVTAAGLFDEEPLLVGPVGSGVSDLVVEAGTAVLRARSLATGELRWTARLPAPLAARPVPTDEAVVAPLADGTVAWLRAHDGTVRHRTDVGGVVTAIAPHDDGVVVGTASGRVRLVGEDGDVDGGWLLGRRTVLDVAVVEDVVVVATGDGLIGLDERTALP